MTTNALGPILVVPAIPVPMATNARLFVIARISGFKVDEMRNIIWARKPLEFPGISETAVEQLKQLFASIGIQTEMRAPVLIPEKPVEPPVPEIVKESVPPREFKAGKPVLLQSKRPAGNKRFFLVKSARISTIFGLVMAIAMFVFFPIFGYLLGFLRVPSRLLSENLAGWIAGAPPESFPALDVSYASAGGSTYATGFFVSVGILLLLAVVAFVFRKSSAWFWLLGCLLLFHSAISLYSAYQLSLLYLGHAVELFFCVLFLFRAFTGTQVLFFSERPMYAVFGWLLWLENLRFGWQLVQSSSSMFNPSMQGDGSVMSYLDLAIGESLDVLGTGLFTLNLAAPSIVLAIMVAMEIKRPKIL